MITRYRHGATRATVAAACARAPAADQPHFVRGQRDVMLDLLVGHMKGSRDET
ncbi:hypothetical protein BTI_5124 [Burkholderia thailandensis MSMB121]|nr:hypothetical protein BTI_5124 [Burkholderia thailandensis MSMB121]